MDMLKQMAAAMQQNNLIMPCGGLFDCLEGLAPAEHPDMPPQERRRRQTSTMDMFKQMAAAMQQNNLIMTVDSFCGGSFDCLEGSRLPGIQLVNTMNSFGLPSLPAFQSHLPSLIALGDRWAPGFLPGNIGLQPYADILGYLPSQNVTAISTWEVHEFNEGGDQPQWLFDTVNAFLDAPL